LTKQCRISIDERHLLQAKVVWNHFGVGTIELHDALRRQKIKYSEQNSMREAYLLDSVRLPFWSCCVSLAHKIGNGQTAYAEHPFRHWGSAKSRTTANSPA
jgi:hypothetical protein